MIAETIRERMAQTIKYVTPVPCGAATGLTAEVYRHMQADFLPVPPLTLHSPVPHILAGVWSILRETLRTGQVNRALKEAVAAAVSKTNACPYCVDVHTSMLHATSNHDAADAILRGDYDHIHDEQLNAIVQWVLANRTPQANGALPPPFAPSDAPEIIGTAIAFHYINRMVNVFLGETFLPVPSALKGLAGRLFGATAGRRFVSGSLRQGDSLKFVPQARLPDDLSWAAANPAVAGAFAGFAEVVDAAGDAVLPAAVRVLVRNHVQAWHGEAMGMSRRWVEDAVVEVKEAHRAAARLALLTALASYQVDASVVEGFQARYPEDAQLIAATAWASFTAARRVGTWLQGRSAHTQPEQDIC
ncbi:MAG TPA: carboxymuconolactone decarboxylase family protein [Roseiflexaceae bacterium]|jgi:AhpD family alkylhydroperoxidase